MLANLPHHSATLQGYTTDLRTFNIHESTTSIGKWRSRSRRGRGKAGWKINFCKLFFPVQVAQWIKKTIPEFFQIVILLVNRQSSYKMSFSRCIKYLNISCDKITFSSFPFPPHSVPFLPTLSFYLFSRSFLSFSLTLLFQSRTKLAKCTTAVKGPQSGNGLLNPNCIKKF